MAMAAAMAGAGEAAPPEPQQPGGSGRIYDPLRGLDANGRIPKATLPDDLPNPEHWRYIPEGRIAPGNLFQRFLITSFISPYFYYEEDVGAGGGIALTDIDFRNQHRREFFGLFAAHSTEGEERYAAVWKRWLSHRHLPAGGVIVEERSVVRVETGYERARTRRFFGFGADSAAADETSYTDEVTLAEVRAQTAVPRSGDPWVATAGVRAEHRNLTAGRVSNRRSTTEVFPDEIADGDDYDSLWLVAGLRWDGRDSQHQAYRGGFVGAEVEASPVQSGGDVGGIAELRAAWSFPLPSPWHDGGDAGEENPPTDTLVFGAFAQSTFGDLPFWALPSLGGADTLRGYIANRFTDRAAWHAAVEYRFWPIARGFAITDAIRMERLGLALFYELGTVAGDIGDLGDAEIHDSYGLGFRMAFERTAVFRVDIGFSDEDTAVTANFGLSF